MVGGSRDERIVVGSLIKIELVHAVGENGRSMITMHTNSQARTKA